MGPSWFLCEIEGGGEGGSMSKACIGNYQSWTYGWFVHKVGLSLPCTSNIGCIIDTPIGSLHFIYKEGGGGGSYMDAWGGQQGM